MFLARTVPSSSRCLKSFWKLRYMGIEKSFLKKLTQSPTNQRSQSEQNVISMYFLILENRIAFRASKYMYNMTCTTGHHTRSDCVRESPSLHNNPMPIHGNAFIITKYKGQNIREFESHKHVYHVARSIFMSWS